MKPLVVDASVAIKWVIPEPGTADALRLRRRRLVAPDLLVAECANILWKKVRRSELTSAEAGFAARLLEQANIELVPMRRLMAAAVDLAMALQNPAYDCIYLALGVGSGWNIVTADDRLRTRVNQIGLSVEVIDLATAAAELAASPG